MPLSNVSKLPDPRVQTGAAPAYRAPPVGEVPNLRDFRSPAEEFARRARVPPAPADLGARLRAMPPADMTGVAERLAPKAAGFGLGALARGAAALAGPVVGGAQMLMHSGSLNSGEDAELARLRAQSPTIDPPGSVMGYTNGGAIDDPYSVGREGEYGMSAFDPYSVVREGERGYDPRSVLREGEPRGYANGGMISAAEELEEMRRDARTAQLLRETAPDMSEVEKRLGAPNGDRLRNGPSPQQFSPEDKIRLNPANAGPQRSLGGMPPPESVPSGTGRYAYSPPADTLGNRALNAAKSVGRVAKGLGMGLGAGALYEGGAAASEASARMVANNPEQFNTSIGDDGFAANIILASREGEAQREAQALREAQANANRPTAQQIERSVVSRGDGGGAGRGNINPPLASTLRRPGRAAAAPSGEPGGMLPQAQPRDEAGFERLIADAQAGRQITTPRGRIGGMDLDAQAAAIHAEDRADLGPGGFIMANGTPYIDLAKGNADPEWRKRFDDRQARLGAISEQRPDANEMPVVIKDGLARIGMGTSAPADVYWNAEQAGGRGRAALENYAGRMGQVRDTQFDEAINPGERESRQKMAQLGVTAEGHVRSSQEQASAQVLSALAQAQAAQAGHRQKMTTDQMEKTISMRKEYEGLPEVKAYKQMVPVYRTMLDATKRDTPMADINLVYGLAKLFDPTSVVREGEYATVAKSPAIPEWLKGQANHLMGGGKLTTETRRQMLAEAKSRMSMAEGELGRVRTQYDRIATDTGLDPSLITLQSFQADGPSAAQGKKTKVIGNTTYVFDGRGWVQQGEN